MTSLPLRRVSVCLLFVLLPSLTTGQGSKINSNGDASAESDQDNPAKRAEWMNRGREAPPGKSAAALRLKAHQQKMAMRAQQPATIAKKDTRTDGGPPSVWVSLGPAPLVSDRNFFGMVSGRATSVAIDPSDSTGNTVYLGGAYGGVWKSINATASTSSVVWNPVTDQQASLATGAVSVKPDGTIVLVGTGEPNNAIDSYYGVGIMRSTDDGATWTLVPSADGGTHPFAGLGAAKFAWSTASGQTNTVVAAMATTAMGFQEGDITGNTNRGLYRSADGGQTWAFQTLPDGGPISATDVIYNATAGKFVAAIRSHGLYTSANGTNWTRLASQPPLLSSTCSSQANCPIFRGQLAVVPGRDETYFWFINIDGSGNMVDEGIWRSINGGTWAQISESGLTNCGDSNGCGVSQAFYNLEIAAVPDGNSTTDLYAGAVNLFKCKLPNNQTTCSTIDSNLPNAWLNLTHVYGVCSGKSMVHPDEHGLDFAVTGGKALMYFANDGGVYRALDGYAGLNIGSCNTAGSNQFDNLNGTIGSMTQFVSFSLHPTDQDTILGGTQDNGSPANSATTTSAQWITVNGGDGGYNAINPTTPTQWFTANTDVSIQVCNSGINCNSNTFTPVVTNANLGGDEGPFYTPYILDPQNAGEMLAGTCRVWRGSTTGSGFLALSPNFDTNATGNAGICSGAEVNLVRALAAGGPKQSGFSNVVYATSEGTGPNGGFTGGEVWATKNAATAVMAPVTGNINPANYTISSVAIDTSDATGQTAYVGIMGFGVSHVFKTIDAGGAGQPDDWTDWTGTNLTSLPDAPVNGLLVDSQAGLVYAGTDVGVFVSSTSTAAWSEVGPNAQPGAIGYLPNVPVSAIRLFNSAGTKKMRASTYGRGIWEFTVALPQDFQIAVSNSPLSIFPNQTAVFNGTLTGINGYNSAVTLSCGTGAPGACSFPAGNPVTPSAGGAAFSVSMNSGGSVADFNFNIHAVGSDAGNTTHDAPVTIHVVDFGLTAPNPNTITAQQGGTSNSTTFQVTASGAFAGAVTLNCTAGLPLGAACHFNPSNTVSPTSANPATLSLTVSTTGSTPVGTVTVTLQANTAGAPAPKQQMFHLTVTAPQDFVWAGGGSHTVLAGQTTLAYSFTATPSGGNFTTAVTLACSNLPDPTVTCTFNPTQISSGAGATPVSLMINTRGPNAGTGIAEQHSGDRRSAWVPLALPIAGIVMAGLFRKKALKGSSHAGMLMAVTFLGVLVACGGGGTDNSGPPPPTPVSVSVSPGTTVNLYADETGNAWPANLTQQQFTAVVNHSSNQAVTWAVTGGAANGMVDSNGLYTAPAAVPNPTNVTITATAQVDSTKSGSGKASILTPTILGTFPNISVTATEGSVSHSQNVSLTVE